MIKNKIKNFIVYILSIFNLKIVNSKTSGPFDLTNKDLNPLAAQYLFGHDQLIMNMDLSIGRTNNWFDLSNDSLDPPIFSIRNALQLNLKDEIFYNSILSNLEEHRSLTKFNNAAEFLDLDNDSCGNLENYPWWAEVNPWDSHTFEDQIKSFPNEVKNNREVNGMRITSNDPEEIIRNDLENSLPSHATQYTKLTWQIKKNGFKYGGNHGYVTAEVFISNNKIRWKPGREGNHRVAVASALGLKAIPVLIKKIIRIDELEYWPNVVNGIFNKDQATKIFFSIFDANPSRIHREWIEKKKQ